MAKRFVAPAEPRKTRVIAAPDGSVVMVRPSHRMRAWLVSHEPGQFIGRFPRLDAALGAAEAFAQGLVPCDQRQTAHT